MSMGDIQLSKRVDPECQAARQQDGLTMEYQKGEGFKYELMRRNIDFLVGLTNIDHCHVGFLGGFFFYLAFSIIS